MNLDGRARRRLRTAVSTSGRAVGALLGPSERFFHTGRYGLLTRHHR